MTKDYKDKLFRLMDEYAHYIYKISNKFPNSEVYGITSQIRRSSLSVVLNYVEGYSRFNIKTISNFYKISYGSLKESKYLIDFVFVEKYINKDEHLKALNLADEIGAMLWTNIKNIKNNVECFNEK